MHRRASASSWTTRRGCSASRRFRSKVHMPNQGAILMQNIQDLDTSGARAAETFVHGGTRYLVVPQLAVDVPGQPAMITVGDSNVDALVYRWQDEAFVPHARLPVPGG